MSESIDIILGGASNGHRKDAFSYQLGNGVANASGITRVTHLVGDRIDEPESAISFAKQQCARVGGNSLIRGLNFDRAIELGLKKVNLVFTHRVILRCVCFGCR